MRKLQSTGSLCKGLGGIELIIPCDSNTKEKAEAIAAKTVQIHGFSVIRYRKYTSASDADIVIGSFSQGTVTEDDEAYIISGDCQALVFNDFDLAVMIASQYFIRLYKDSNMASVTYAAP